MALPDLSGTPRQRTGIIDLVGRVLAGRYRLVAPVGVGASAQVYVADDVQLRRRVAVKVLHPGLAGDPTFLKRFQAEAQAAAALNHPNVVAIYDWGRDETPGAGDAVPFLVTEYLEGGSLRSILDGDGTRGSRPLSLSQVLVVGLEVCRGLHYAHNRGFVHRDIKPANLLFGDDRRLRIADFGLARALAEASWTEPEGVVLGTARYVSPEQAAGQTVDTRSDLYSLALVLVESVTGVVPYTSDTAVGTLQARIGRSITVEESTFGPLTELIEAAGRADPAERCTAAQLGAALMNVASRLPAPEPLRLAPPPVFAPIVPADAGTQHFGGDVPIVIADPAPVVVADPVERAATPEAMPVATPGTPSAAVAPPARSSTAAAPAVAASGVAAAEVAAAEPAGGGPEATGEAGVAAARRARRRRRRPRIRTLFVSLLVVAALVVLAVLGYGLLGDRVLGPTRFPVAGYVGRNIVEVQQELEASGYGWVLDVTTERQDGSSQDEILRQDPAGGAKLAKGETLHLVRSLGATLVDLPVVTGKPIDDPAVTQAFSSRTLLIHRVERFDETQPPGIVLGLGTAATEVERGSTVDVLVSVGAQPRTVKDYTKPEQAVDAVKADLTAVGLVAEVVQESSETVKEGVVIGTDPPAGTALPKGSTVKVVVSSGLPMLTVPNVYGMTARDADDLLTGQGWVIKSIVGSSSGKVIATDPVEGAQRRKGSYITILTQSN